MKKTLKQLRAILEVYDDHMEAFDALCRFPGELGELCSLLKEKLEEAFLSGVASGESDHVIRFKRAIDKAGIPEYTISSILDEVAS